MYKIARLCLALFLALPLAHAQTADQDNEGLRLSNLSNTGAFELSWWGRTGLTYFIQYSDDLLSAWSYVPVIEKGADAVIHYGFTDTSERFFFRLRHTTDTAENVDTADFDGDGVSNMDELQQGTDPLIALGARLAITWPAESAAIPGRTVDVIGTWGAIASLRTLTLNGQPVYIAGNTWSAPAIPLLNGSNTLTLVSTDAKGIITTIIRTITASYAETDPAPVTLAADIIEGSAPLLVTFSPQVNITGTIQSVTYYYEGRGGSAVTGTDLNATSFAYNTSGVYYPTVTVKFADGSVYSSGGVTTPLAQRLKVHVSGDDTPLAAWSALKTSLANQDIEAASASLCTANLAGYQELFTQIGPADARQMVDNLINLTLVAILDDAVAQYSADANTPLGLLTFSICFVKENGAWKVESF